MSGDSGSDYFDGYDKGYEAGRKAERERAAQIARDFAEHAYRERMDADEQDPVWHLREREAVCRDVARAILSEPAAPSATAEHETHLSPDQLAKPEPARPLTLEARARAIMPNAVPSDLMTEHWTNTFTREVSNLCRDFAREALRAAIVIERPYVDRSDLCVSTAEVTCMMFPENRKPFLSVARENEAVAREQITDAVIAAAEKGEVPR